MNVRDLPVVTSVLESGADNRVFDLFLLVGPLLIALIVVLDRALLTKAIAVVYIAAFVAYVLYQGIK